MAAGRLENGNTTSIYVSLWSESVIFSKYYWGCTSKDCSSKFRSKHSTVLLLCSLRNLLEQSLKAFCIQIKILQFFLQKGHIVNYWINFEFPTIVLCSRSCQSTTRGGRSFGRLNPNRRRQQTKRIASVSCALPHSSLL